MRTENGTGISSGYRSDDCRISNRTPQSTERQQEFVFLTAAEEAELDSRVEVWWTAKKGRAANTWRAVAKALSERERSGEGLHGQDSQDAKEVTR